MIAAAGALLGSRLLGLFEHPYLLRHPSGLWFCYLTNRTIMGGSLGGLVGVGLTQKCLGITASFGIFPYDCGLCTDHE